VITKVEVQNNKGETLALPLDDYSNGYLVKSIEGLGPVKASLVSSGFAQIDGTQPQSEKRGERNITTKIGLEPNYVTTTVESLRNNLYRFLMPKATVTLRFFVDGVLFVTTVGKVESNDPAIFTSEPEMDISIVCNDPDFYALDSVIVPGNTVATPLEQTITYDGTTDVGVTLQLNVNRAMDGFFIYNTLPDNTIQTFEVDAPLLAGDIVKVISVERKKAIRLIRGGVDTSLLNAYSPSSTWVKLMQGDNGFRVYAVGDPVPYTVEYLAKYGGL
jgi:hypothetical protein